MDIIKEFQQYPKAWEAFLEWCPFKWKRRHFKTVVADSVYANHLLADMQAFLDSVGIYTGVELQSNKPTYLGQCAKINTNAPTLRRVLYNDLESNKYSTKGFDTRPEALKAAVLKGLEIFENSKQ